MRVGLNATCFNARPSGANQRFRTLYGAVIRRNPDIRFILYEPADYPVGSWFGPVDNLEIRRTPLRSSGRVGRQWAGLCYWRRALAGEALDLFENFSLPLVGAPCPNLLTVHDLQPIRHGNAVMARVITDMVLHHAFARADRVMVVSQAMRDDLLRFHPGTRVDVVFNGVDPSVFKRQGGKEAVGIGLRRRLPDEFALAVGHFEPRKNLGLLVDAIAVLRDRGQSRPLVIVGRDGGEGKALRRRIAERQLERLITVIEDADDLEVRALYAACRLVVTPSRYEGFGIPLIEAMAARRPLAVSDIPVFRELTGGQGAYFPVDDPAAAADTMERVWTDEAERGRLIAVGLDRLGTFDVDRLADRIVSVYAAVIEDRDKTVARRERAAAKE